MLPDPRIFPTAADAASERLHRLAREALDAPTGDAALAALRTMDETLRAWIAEGHGERIARALDLTPSVDVHRCLVRALASAIRPRDDALARTLFAIPVVLIVAAAERRVLDAVLPDAAALTALLVEHGALRGNRTIALSNALVAAAALDPSRLPALCASAALPAGDGRPPPHLVPAPIETNASGEGAHLRFLVGATLSSGAADPLGDASVGAWGMPLSAALSRALATKDASVLALPRPAQSLATAVGVGRSAQREASAQLFASNAIRRLRGSFGEPSAVVSAHRLNDGRGELRLSLSTPLEDREAEGFRCPLHPFDRVGDVATMLVDLMRDCRVTDIRVVDGVHADRDAATGLPLLFKPETIPPSARITLH